ncbi:hypothetical protein B0H16DRAFT_1468390 [Mycena metata]|uniref:Uncharacterized protein n=1 Tax=Mycena metata TaxID=1033252 RepID=A0AAD7MU91_9AGAR|nr:hypothetical protein B0H16DRAFT_1468390 [Mycena metata]
MQGGTKSLGITRKRGQQIQHDSYIHQGTGVFAETPRDRTPSARTINNTIVVLALANQQVGPATYTLLFARMRAVAVVVHCRGISSDTPIGYTTPNCTALHGVLMVRVGEGGRIEALLEHRSRLATRTYGGELTQKTQQATAVGRTLIGGKPVGQPVANLYPQNQRDQTQRMNKYRNQLRSVKSSVDVHHVREHPESCGEPSQDSGASLDMGCTQGKWFEYSTVAASASRSRHKGFKWQEVGGKTPRGCAERRHGLHLLEILEAKNEGETRAARARITQSESTATRGPREFVEAGQLLTRIEAAFPGIRQGKIAQNSGEESSFDNGHIWTTWWCYKGLRPFEAAMWRCFLSAPVIRIALVVPDVVGDDVNEK